ncbi:non-ribosomal peptide synthetase [Nitrococcus mobilis]|uniref:Amino acid adenylation n=1 Tax=Nitrococcus mobilis Nb-231 TaxID=314278 RepID=A4BRH6_9GAMM|nr:non-ribosomal peptide synthetase [Nitrococcus mobilis]EAR21798.1 Amino acid adenylation [Nitrococcus mobilis Nb-231]
MENKYFEGLPLSPEQRFILAESEPEFRAGGSEKAAILAISMHGAVDEARLRAALTAVVAAHESLRMAFRHFPGYRGLRQQPLSPTLDWETVDLRAAPDTQRRMAERVRCERITAFDLEQGRSVRAVLFRIADGRWRLVLAVSRLVADRLSLENLYRALLTAYDRPAAEATQTVQYPQFVEWRRELEQGEDAEAGCGYWAGLGLDSLAAPRLAYRLRGSESPIGAPEHACVNQHLEKPIAAGLLRLAEAHDWPLESLLQAAWWALLARISGESAFAGGWQHDCRRDYELLAAAVGVFDKILPLAVRLSFAEPFSNWVERLDRSLEDHRGWQEHWPVAEPLHTSHLAVGFDLAGGLTPGNAAGLRCHVDELPGSAPSFELALQAVLDEAGYPRSVALYYACSCYSEAAVQHLLRQYLTLLAALPTHAFEAIADLPLVGPTERDSLLALNGSALDVGQQALPARIAYWAASSPAAPALASRDLNLSYTALNTRVNRLAHWLGQHGVGPGSLVALALPRSGELVVAVLAILRAGGAYLPLDPDWPEGRWRKVVADARPRLVLTSSAVDPRAMGDVHCVKLDTLADELAACPESPPAVELRLDQAAYVLYTSGSSGEPKGVVIEHGQLLNYAAAVSVALDLAVRRRFALTSTVAADLGNTVLFGAFFNGGCLIVADAEDMQDAASFARFMLEQDIDCLKIVPSHLEALLDTESATLPRTLILGGEATPRALVERLVKLAPDCRIHNHYGPTETTVGVMAHTFDPQDAWCGDALPLSQPLANCSVYLLDEARRLVPTGALGELYLGGAQVCRGYLNRPADDVFIDDPFRPGERLYRSGDLGRYLPGGSLQLAGRTDDQLKIRGFRIEPAEVELALLTVPGIRQAAVRAWGEGEQRQLFAYVVAVRAEGGGELDEAALKQELKKHLASAMLPAHVFVLPQLPRLANGKTDRQALPAPTDLSKRSAYVAPRDAVEAVLANVWAELLKREKVSVTDSFFDLGGHSLLVIKLVARIRKLLQVEILPGLVFDHPSIEALAQALPRFESEPGQLEQVAALRQRLMSLNPEEHKALLEKARLGSAASEA